MIFYDKSVIMHTYIHIRIDTNSHTHTPTYLHKVLPTVCYGCHFVISSYQKSYQQYFDILLDYQKVQVYCYKKIKNRNK